MKIIGVDAATWDIIKPNIDRLENFKQLMNKCQHKTLTVDEKPKSAAVWTSIFTGKTQAEHGHQDFMVDDKLQKREDIDADFVWEKLDDVVDVRILQVPAIAPPINWNTDYEPEGFGLSSDPEELEKDLENLKQKCIQVLEEDPDLFGVVFMQLDRISHFYWGEDIVLEFYEKVDEVLGELLEYHDFEDDEPLIVLSDHGFAEHGEGRVQTLPKETPKGKIKGDHHEDAILMVDGVDITDIDNPEDVGKKILENYNQPV
jgi:predicted AlkP superfamily phosphohydrolase/phosphomutase